MYFFSYFRPLPPPSTNCWSGCWRGMRSCWFILIMHPSCFIPTISSSQSILLYKLFSLPSLAWDLLCLGPSLQAPGFWFARFTSTWSVTWISFAQCKGPESGHYRGEKLTLLKNTHLSVTYLMNVKQTIGVKASSVQKEWERGVVLNAKEVMKVLLPSLHIPFFFTLVGCKFCSIVDYPVNKEKALFLRSAKYYYNMVM